MDWRERIRSLWIERAVWIRHYIMSLMMGLKDLSYVATRAFRNGTEFGRIITQIYGIHIGVRFENILTQHLLLLSEIASTVRMGADISVLEPAWTANAESLVSLLLEINPAWTREGWQSIIYDKFRIQLEFVHHLSQSKYAEGIELFDRAHENARQIAQKMVDGIEQQFGSPLV